MMSDPNRDDVLERSVDRRSLLISTGLTAMAGVSASVAGASTGFIERMLRERFAELSPERKAEILDQLEQEYSRRFGREVSVENVRAKVNMIHWTLPPRQRRCGCRPRRRCGWRRR